MFRNMVKKIHFVGIGGIGMSAIAEVLIKEGFLVSGSDLSMGQTVAHLQKLGATIYEGHAKEQISGADVVVVTSAVNGQNPEVLAAREKKIPVVHRSEILADLMRYKYGICVAGTHGKTTITSLISTLLVKGGLDPTAIVGGIVHDLGSNGHYGAGEYLVAEADESDGSFLRLFPTLAVISNIEADHLDHYTGGLAEIRAAFKAFADKVPFYGKIIACLDDQEVAKLIPELKRPVITYGFSEKAAWRAENIRLEAGHMSYDLCHNGEKVAMRLKLLGRHNVLNSLAAIAVAREVGIELSVIKDVFENYHGVGRRLELKGEVRGITIIDDYGHHPTEIKTTLKALKEALGKRRLVVAFQPHRYSRTKALLKEFAGAFTAADELYLTDVYSAGEEPIAGVDGECLFKAVQENGQANVHYQANLGELKKQLMSDLKSGDLFLTLGAGNLFTIGEALLKEESFSRKEV